MKTTGNKALLGILVMALGLMVMMACADKQQDTMHDKVQAYIDQSESKLDAMEEKLQDLEEEMKGETAETRAAIENEIGDLKENMADVRGKLKEIQDKGEGAWDNLKDTIDDGISRIESSYDKIKHKVTG